MHNMLCCSFVLSAVMPFQSMCGCLPAPASLGVLASIHLLDMWCDHDMIEMILRHLLILTLSEIIAWMLMLQRWDWDKIERDNNSSNSSSLKNRQTLTQKHWDTVLTCPPQASCITVMKKCQNWGNMITKKHTWTIAAQRLHNIHQKENDRSNAKRGKSYVSSSTHFLIQSHPLFFSIY